MEQAARAFAETLKHGHPLGDNPGWYLRWSGYSVLENLFESPDAQKGFTSDLLVLSRFLYIETDFKAWLWMIIRDEQIVSDGGKKYKVQAPRNLQVIFYAYRWGANRGHIITHERPDFQPSATTGSTINFVKTGMSQVQGSLNLDGSSVKVWINRPETATLFDLLNARHGSSRQVLYDWLVGSPKIGFDGEAGDSLIFPKLTISSEAAFWGGRSLLGWLNCHSE